MAYQQGDTITAADYNTFATNVNAVIGTGSGAKGYGLSDECSFTIIKVLPYDTGRSAKRKERSIHVKYKSEYSTAYSQAVTHPSTNAAQCCLTSVIGRELVFSTWYGRIPLNTQD